MDNIFFEIALVFDDVVDDAAEKHDVGSRPDGDMDIRHGAGARESRIDVNNHRAAPFGLHHPLKADGMAFGHVGPLDHDAVRILQVLLECGRAASTE